MAKSTYCRDDRAQPTVLQPPTRLRVALLGHLGFFSITGYWSNLLGAATKFQLPGLVDEPSFG